MRISTPFSLAALGLLGALTNCAASSEKERSTTVVTRAQSVALTTPAAMASAPAAPADTLANAPAAAADAPTVPAVDSTGAARSAPDVRAGVLATEGASAGAPTAREISAERSREKKMTGAEYRQMLATADAALENNPKDAAALLQRAKAKSYLHEYPAAQLDYSAALRYQRNNPDAYYNRGVNHLMMKKYKAASADFAGALRYRPDDKESFFGRGVAKMQMLQYKPAVADFTHAIQIDSAYADAWEYRGISYASFDKMPEARRDLEHATDLNPNAAKSLRRYVGHDGKEPIKVAPMRAPRPTVPRH
ncbi:tetratricopeptide repeat protein [Hymenobacter coccineus]|uniref:Uncharacterized protein n=1 Tax=Hymenobacter coccineus TaxID=1908235 RepID=A0A1G1THU8_9BACT|nr:tetratricopeptide repeat protein [Hymenobacter coccineus]OGX90444.1 hypothetical protein BEN49_06580 [Hymenobacter coccineus]